MFDAGAMASKLGLDLSGYASGMLQATSIASVFPQTVTAFLANPLLGLAEVAKNVSGVIVSAVQSWLHAIAEFGNRADDVGDKAAALGVSPDFLSGWGAAFKDAGSSMEGFADTLKFINDNAQEAVRGNKTAAESFAQIGVNVDFLKANLGDTEQLMRRTVDAIAKLPTAAERIGAARNLLGRGGADAVGAISGGTEGLDKFAETIRRLGGVVTQEDADMADAFGKLSVYVDAAFQGIQRAAARPVLRALKEHFGDAETGIVAVSENVQAAVERLSQWIVDRTEEAVQWWKKHGDEVERFGDVVMRTSGGIGVLVTQISGAVGALTPLITLLERLDELLAPIGGAASFLSPVMGGLGRLSAFDAAVNSVAGPAPAAPAAGGGVVIQQLTVTADPNTMADDIARQIRPQLGRALQGMLMMPPVVADKIAARL
jgi:hypothetical protein